MLIHVLAIDPAYPDCIIIKIGQSTNLRRRISAWNSKCKKPDSDVRRRYTLLAFASRCTSAKDSRANPALLASVQCGSHHPTLAPLSFTHEGLVLHEARDIAKRWKFQYDREHEKPLDVELDPDGNSCYCEILE